jgi:hypothetical protein
MLRGEVRLQGVQAVGPEAPVSIDPVVDLGEALPPQRVDAALAVGRDLDETRLPQHLEVARDGRLGDAGEGIHQLPRGPGALEEEVEERAAARVGDGGEDVHPAMNKRPLI